MKILHTADWHLNDRLGTTDRTEHLRARVEEVAAICEREAVDVLVIAGDIFSERCRVDAFRNELADSLRHLRAVFQAFFQRGGIILGITGNHDQDGLIRNWIDLARAGMDLAERPRARGDHFDRGKMYLLNTSFVGRVRDAAGFDVQFVLLPFPKQASVLTGHETFTTAPEFHRVTQEAVANWIRELPELPGYDPRLRSVFVGHLYVTGADLGHGLNIGIEQTGLVIDAAALPTGFDYVALGDIHKPQCLLGTTHIRYSGSLDRMDFGEASETKQVVLVEIGPAGRVGEPRAIPLTPTSFATYTLHDPQTAHESLTTQREAAGAEIVKVILTDAALRASATVEAAIRDVVPNVARVERSRLEAAAVGPLASMDGTVRERVLRYLNHAVADETQREKLVALATIHLDRQAQR